MKQDIYLRMLKHIVKVGSGLPHNKEILKILRKHITSEEAEIVLGLPIRLPPLEVEAVDIIADRLRKPSTDVEKILENLYQKGFLFKRKLSSGNGYAFIQLGYGIPQKYYWKGEMDREAAEAARPLRNYLMKGAFANELIPSKETKFYRYIPVTQSVSRTVQTVLPYEVLEDMVRKTRRIALLHCECRQSRRILNSEKSIFKGLSVNKKECTHTIENCIKFDDMADYVIDKGYGPEISVEEALRIIKEAEKEGLIHWVDNCKDGLHHLCNCCTCCCWQLTLIKSGFVKRDDIMAAYFQRITENKKCIHCGLCAKDCPMEIIKMKKGLPVVNSKKCIGCGLCVLRCPTKAALLNRRNKKEPYSDFLTLHKKIITDAIKKGK